MTVESQRHIGVGTNEAGAEFGEDIIPGELVCSNKDIYYVVKTDDSQQGTDYTWPNTSTIGTLMDAGMNIFRVNWKMERLFPESLIGTMDETYLGDLRAVS